MKDPKIKVAQEIVNELYTVRKVIVEKAPFTVKIMFNGKRSMRITGKYASDIIKAGKLEGTVTGRIRNDKPNFEEIPKTRR